MTEEIILDGYFRPSNGPLIPASLLDKFKPGHIEEALKLWKSEHPNHENLDSDLLHEECENSVLEYYAQRHWI